MKHELGDLATESLLAEMLAHAAAEQPRECCGLLVALRPGGRIVYLRARNVWPEAKAEPDRFTVDPATWAEAEDSGEILAVVHSHVNASANPSMADRVGCEASGLPWLIVGWPSEVVKLVQPEGWEAPYLGREYASGVLDCYTLGQDWYRRELAIVLPDLERPAGRWWERRPGHPPEDVYMRRYAEAGFERVYGPPQRHDVILMQVKADVANHAAIYLGDSVMLHHPEGRLSDLTTYGGYWAHHTVALLRHRDTAAALAAQASASARAAA